MGILIRAPDWYDWHYFFYGLIMKNFRLIVLFLFTLPVFSCVDKSKGSGYLHDTLAKGSVDTIGQQILPGTPGAGGTEAGAKDSLLRKNDTLALGKDSAKKNNGY